MAAKKSRKAGFDRKDQDPKPKKKRGSVSPADRAAMMRDFLAGATKSAIAKKFGVSRQTVIKISQQDLWDQATREKSAAVAKGIIESVAKSDLANLDILYELRDQLRSILIENKTLILSAKPADLVKCVLAIEEIERNGRTDDKVGDIIVQLQQTIIETTDRSEIDRLLANAKVGNSDSDDDVVEADRLASL